MKVLKLVLYAAHLEIEETDKINIKTQSKGIRDRGALTVSLELIQTRSFIINLSKYVSIQEAATFL
jgi:hypothetical protein